MVSKSSVVGIDLGAADSYVAFVGKGIVDIVQNEVSKRATPSIVGFTDRERLLGDTALALIRSNVKNTCRNFKHLLGRKIDAPDVQIENFWSTSELTECEDGHAGYLVKYKGEERKMSAVEVTAMYLTKLRDITEAWCDGKVTDVVIAVPSSFADVQRQALLDAAKVAGMSVLRLMNEHTATALAYGIYRSNDFDPEKPMTVAFCSMGHSLFSVSVVRFVRGKLTVVCEKSDKVGGRELDECLMREFASQFKAKEGCDPLCNKKAKFKLEDAVQKTKKILSANSEAGITCDCLMEDADLSGQITREDLERMCAPAIDRARAVLESAISASGLSLEQIDSVEIVGGGSRVPWVKGLCSEIFGGKALSTTMNQEESVARGCALQAAMLSPLYKVREFKVEDISPFSISLSWMGSADEAEWKTSVVFPEGSLTNTCKTLTFSRSGPFEIRAQHAEAAGLLPLTPQQLGSFRIDLPPQEEPKQVKVRAKLTLHGTFQIEGAQLLEEEEYEEVVKEKRCPPGREQSDERPASPGQPQEGESTPQAAAADAKAEERTDHGHNPQGETPPGGSPTGASADEPTAEWVEVRKTKRRTKRTELAVVAAGTPGLDEETLQRLASAEAAMQAEMREILETDAKRNDLEAYVLDMRGKIADGGEYGEYISSERRAAFSAELDQAEDWLYDNPEATKAMLVERLEGLRGTGDQVVRRWREAEVRAEGVQGIGSTIDKYRCIVAHPGEAFSHIADDKMQKVGVACDELEQWLATMQAQQSGLPKHEDPVLLSAEMQRRSNDLSALAEEILREPKAAPPQEAADAPEATGESSRPGKEETSSEDASTKGSDDKDSE
mmetsp:Transcript_104147/g.301280  ORF Transcript_104147/g.301280 Transcript_104147/m.301280 type:complete len:841 (-) Transcript_104147:90-2612(-)